MDVVLRVASHSPLEPSCLVSGFRALGKTVPSSSPLGSIGVPLLVGEGDKLLAYVFF